MKPFPRLVTDRLVLRAFTAADAPAVERYAGDRSVADTTLTIPHPYPAGAAAAWIETHAPQWEAGTLLNLAICSRSDDADLIGAVGLTIAPEHAHAEIGYWIRADAWGQGYATEASRAMLGFGFGDLGLHRILARHFVRNPASGQVMRKLGMTREGVHRDAYLRWGRFETVAVYGILGSEWACQPSGES